MYVQSDRLTLNIWDCMQPDSVSATVKGGDVHVMEILEPTGSSIAIGQLSPCDWPPEAARSAY